ncbi:Nramp family divalent metal transporter [Yeosuana sp. MJ-SS3]|uniref:Nramp family divalent metal transporter n=1 Tax=Gilvirhabdus luticola TaxID=3079858 RepID=A0ABU3U847_9FLAO|nr:Nramp family divalent metal transporter [Yeosuana sp. MJ-SS3]MDU8886260.1 Nramp family divalent metal transporter [Yeosuana sp. MJ-SS3]
MAWLKNIGPGPLVAAAFIGPGTVTVCTLAGVNFGFVLLWTIVLSIIATIVLQEMAARLGIVTQKGLSEVIREEIKNKYIKAVAILLILFAIVIGNAAYEAGNITGSVLGFESLIGKLNINIGSRSINGVSIIIGIIAFALLYLGNYKVLERVLIFLVVIMSIAFVITAVLTEPDFSEILKHTLTPTFPKGSLLTIVGLIGTTVVPYNLFLHASLVKEKWKSKNDLKYARKDLIIAVVLGGVVSMCIIISAAAIQTQDIKNATDLAKGLAPFFGSYAKVFLAIGLFAAGITSAITAPLAAAYVANGCLGWNANLRAKKFRMVWMFILLLGIILSSISIKPIEIIKFAQVANGILLPVIAGFLLWIMNRSLVLETYKNSLTQNILGFIILTITIFLGAKSLLTVFNVI